MSIRIETAKKLAESEDFTIADLAKHYLAIVEVAELGKQASKGFKESMPHALIESLIESSRKHAAQYGMDEDASFALTMCINGCPSAPFVLLHLATCTQCITAVGLVLEAVKPDMKS